MSGYTDNFYSGKVCERYPLQKVLFGVDFIKGIRNLPFYNLFLLFRHRLFKSRMHLRSCLTKKNPLCLCHCFCLCLCLFLCLCAFSLFCNGFRSHFPHSSAIWVWCGSDFSSKKGFSQNWPQFPHRQYYTKQRNPSSKNRLFSKLMLIKLISTSSEFTLLAGFLKIWTFGHKATKLILRK